MLDYTLNILSWLFMVTGAFFMLSGALGILRMPDFFSRLHPAGITDSFGAPMLLIGVLLKYGFSLFAGKIFLLILFLFITNPTSTHILSQAAIIAKVKPYIKDKK